jgi:gliding motility-associated lipoprotein GldD
MSWKQNNIWIIILLLALSSCDETYIPKPKGYPRIDLPTKNYVEYSSPCPVDLEIPAYSKVELIADDNAGCRFNLSFPRLKARIHFTYLPVEDNLDTYLQDAYNFAYKHEIKATAINQTPVQIDSANVNGLIYDLKGHVASQLQFYLTDSTDHFLRGALYFRARPNPDSLAPVLDFLREDMLHLINHASWRYEP